jgi:hypothetical protein
MSIRSIHRAAVLASAAALTAGLSLAAPTTALATVHPAGEPNSCALGSYCLYIGSNYTQVIAEGNGKVTNAPVGVTITAVENNTPWTVTLQYGRNTRMYTSNTRTMGINFYTATYTVG